jgi:hypothetical protein
VYEQHVIGILFESLLRVFRGHGPRVLTVTSLTRSAVATEGRIFEKPFPVERRPDWRALSLSKDQSSRAQQDWAAQYYRLHQSGHISSFRTIIFPAAVLRAT